jgi:hypothetical protein
MNTEPTRDVSHDPTSEIGWGIPAAAHPTTPSRPAPPAGPNGWATLRKVMFWTVIVLGVPGIGVGLVAIAEDMSDTTDTWHGFGIAIGLILAVPCLVLCLLAGFGLRSMRRRGPHGGRAHALVVGVLLVAVLIFVGLTPFLLLPATLGAALLVSVLADPEGQPT